MRIQFTKMHGLGNDFIVFEAATELQIPTAEQLRKLSNRRTGIGFDQALVIQPPRRAGTDLFYRNFNADGSEVEQCGNGARCVASLVALKRGVARTLNMDTIAGLINAEVRQDAQGNRTVSLDMGEPNFTPSALPFDVPSEQSQYVLDVAGERVEIGAVSMGNPHAVIKVASVDSAPVERLGALIETHRQFPNRVNVGFMEIIARDHIRLRVFERGVGETLACGTGGCGAVAVGRKLGWLDATVNVDFLGGRASVTWNGPGNGPGNGLGSHLWLTGPAVSVFEGHVDID